MDQKINQLIESTSHVFLDKAEAIKLVTVGLLAHGHLLIEDVPGVGKTTLVQTIGKLLGLQTHRIQFTIDLLPADLLGGHIFNPADQKFHFHPGPLFAQLILADELNRASPRTQSALLQAMEEGQVSLDGRTWDLPHPFFVIATQNPHQNQGTFPLPDSQLDRFMLSLELNYASKETEVQIFAGRNPRDLISALKPVMTDQELIQVQKQVDQVKVSKNIAEYVASLLENSRQPDFSGESISTRGGLSLVKAGKAWAYLAGRDYVVTDDIQSIIEPVLGHRLGGVHGLQQGREWARLLAKKTPVVY